MQKRWWILINVFVLILVGFALFYVVSNSSYVSEEVEDCIDVNNVASFVYDVCYDAYSKQLYVEVERGSDSYVLNEILFSFFDVSQKSYSVSDVPNVGGAKYYKILAAKNPGTLNVYLDVVKYFSADICSTPRVVSVDYCSSGTSQEDLSSNISPLTGDNESEIVDVTPSAQQSDTLSRDLVEKEKIWASECESRWSCSSWDECVDGVQHRTCTDLRKCFIPTDSPDTVRYCDGTCVEEWVCEWSKCRNGFTVPDCTDVNRCGTDFDIPEPLSCDVSGECTPDIVCDSWSECSAEYSFLDLISGVQNIGGTHSRICRDLNSCTDDVYEEEECSVGVDVFTRRVSKCGIDYIGVYNSLTGKLISRVDIGDANNPHFAIDLDGDSDPEYCDYCSDGIMNGDETGIDCGGSCETCESKYVDVGYVKQGFWDKVANWFLGS